MPVSVPTFIKQAWAAVGTKFTIPDNANPTTGRAGWDQGFSPINLTPVAAGGIPPFGQDMNGVLYDITSAIQYIQAGRPFPYNQDFADAIGGYGKGSFVFGSDQNTYISIVDSNLTQPPSAGWIVSNQSGFTQQKSTNGWQLFPSGLLIQWGVASVNGLTGSSFTYPIAFPNSVFTLSAAVESGTDTSIFATVFKTTSPNIRGSARLNQDVTKSVNWIAIGF